MMVTCMVTASTHSDRFHSLDNHGLNVTVSNNYYTGILNVRSKLLFLQTFCGRHVSIATTPMKLLSAPGTIVATPQNFSQPRPTVLVDKNS